MIYEWSVLDQNDYVENTFLAGADSSEDKRNPLMRFFVKKHNLENSNIWRFFVKKSVEEIQIDFFCKVLFPGYSKDRFVPTFGGSRSHPNATHGGIGVFYDRNCNDFIKPIDTL